MRKILIKWILILSSHTSIPVSRAVEFFEKHLDKVNWSCLSNNSSIPVARAVEFYEKHLDKVDWYFLF